MLDNLPEFYQLLIPKIVAQLENLPRADRRSLESWLVRQRGEPRTFHLDGVVLETENGDEYGVPFVLFSDDDLKVLKPEVGTNGWRRIAATILEAGGSRVSAAFAGGRRATTIGTCSARSR